MKSTMSRPGETIHIPHRPDPALTVLLKVKPRRHASPRAQPMKAKKATRKRATVARKGR
jgi:hypothetical protein